MRDAKCERLNRPRENCLKPECGSDKAGAFEPFITKAEVAERMDVEAHTIARLVSRGVLRHYKMQALVRFKWSEVEEDMRRYFGVGFEPEQRRKEAKE